MVRGERPFQGVYDQALVYEIVNQEPEPLTGVRTGVPMELEWIVGKCLAKDREDRYGRAEDMMLDLRTLAEKLKSGGSTVLRTGVGAQRAVPAPSHAVEASWAQHAAPPDKLLTCLFSGVSTFPRYDVAHAFLRAVSPVLAT